MAETARARAWIATTLKNDATLQGLADGIEDRIFDRPAPAKTPYPLIRMELRSPGEDFLLLGGEIGWAEPLVLVYAVTDKPSTATIEPLADRIHALLHKASGTTEANDLAAAATVWQCVRERPFDLPDSSVNPAASRLGGEYRFLVSQS